MKPLRPKNRRNANYKLLEVSKLFVPAQDTVTPEGTCGNIQNLIDDTSLKGPNTWEKSFRGSVSAPYLLSRLITLFEGLKIEVHGQSAYKITWSAVLVHPETGFRFTFYDYKGAASFGSDVVKSGTKAEKAFIKDAKKLLAVLRDERCPHPYDGCVIGEVA